MKKFILGVLLILTPVIIYEIILTVLASLGITDSPTMKVIVAAVYSLISVLLIVIFYENISSLKNRFLTVLLDILTGSALFFLVHPSWAPVFYLLISLFVLFYWHKRQKGA
ncbi:hypothetical protein [Acinetobacter baumannii]|uniref:hypothetical protein n=1 Tax=Acinetobacter baumannii TaxID=470 RepID=UPI0009AB82D9|nr:hypothetical protein [Acinetobacter baumannii]